MWWWKDTVVITSYLRFVGASGTPPARGGDDHWQFSVRLLERRLANRSIASASSEQGQIYTFISDVFVFGRYYFACKLNTEYFLSVFKRIICAFFFLCANIFFFFPVNIKVLRFVLFSYNGWTKLTGVKTHHYQLWVDLVRKSLSSPHHAKRESKKYDGTYGDVRLDDPSLLGVRIFYMSHRMWFSEANRYQYSRKYCLMSSVHSSLRCQSGPFYHCRSFQG